MSVTPVKQVAIELGLPVTHRLADVLDVGAELGIVVAFGRIIPEAILAELAMVNLHLSLLPRWRGAAPVERAILAGDPYGGVCLMALDEGLDTGPIYEAITVPIDPTETAEQLTFRLGELGTDALVSRLRHGIEGLGAATPQVGEATYAEKLTVDDHHLDFSRTALECLRVVRIGRAWTTFRGKRLLVHDQPAGTLGAQPPGLLADGEVATRGGWLSLDSVQLEGRSAQSYAEFANGAHPTHGERLGDGQGDIETGASLRR
jgi:methionyl-tRNA formyltransferase